MAAKETKRGRARSRETRRRILSVTEKVLVKQGASSAKVRGICEAANISRAAFYRYFSSKEDLLEALIDYQRERLDRVLDEHTAGCETPRDWVIAYFESMQAFLASPDARLLLESEPRFLIQNFKRFFPQSVERAKEWLAPAFDVWDSQRGTKIDRKLVAELFVRYVLSDMWVPSECKPLELVDRLAKTIADFQTMSAGHTAAEGHQDRRAGGAARGRSQSGARLQLVAGANRKASPAPKQRH